MTKSIGPSIQEWYPSNPKKVVVDVRLRSLNTKFLCGWKLSWHCHPCKENLLSWQIVLAKWKSLTSTKPGNPSSNQLWSPEMLTTSGCSCLFSTRLLARTVLLCRLLAERFNEICLLLTADVCPSEWSDCLRRAGYRKCRRNADEVTNMVLVRCFWTPRTCTLTGANCQNKFVE